MKAFINEDGALVVTPDTPTEAYALDSWRRAKIFEVKVSSEGMGSTVAVNKRKVISPDSIIFEGYKE